MSDKTEIRTLETVQRELVETWMKIVEQIPIIKEYYSFFESSFKIYRNEKTEPYLKYILCTIKSLEK